MQKNDNAQTLLPLIILLQSKHFTLLEYVHLQM